MWTSVGAPAIIVVDRGAASISVFGFELSFSCKVAAIALRDTELFVQVVSHRLDSLQHRWRPLALHVVPA